MNFEHTEDRRMLADTLNRFVAEQYGIETRNHIAYGDTGMDPALWGLMAMVIILGGILSGIFTATESGAVGALGALVIALAGGTAMASLGLLIAARLQNEELASGLLNLISLPMMFLSGVWFSLEGSPPWLQAVGARLPLSQIIEAARAVMLEGAGWQAVAGTLGQVMVFALVCITLGAVLFKWSAK